MPTNKINGWACVRATAIAALVAAVPGVSDPALAQTPLSAIDWLSRSVGAPAAQPGDQAPGGPQIPAQAAPFDPVPYGPQTFDLAPPRSDGERAVRTAPISVVPIGAPGPDAVGLLPPSVSGLPRSLWGPAPTADIVALIAAADAGGLPALQGLIYTLLLAEVDPPTDSGPGNALFLARIDKLIALGALEQATALLDAAGPATPAIFARAFDVALLTGEEDRACATLREQPGLAPTMTARVYCLGRGEDWSAAAVTLAGASALGLATGGDVEALHRFLDPALAEEAAPLQPPQRPSPVIWRVYEAIGEPVPTHALPVAFSHADLRGNTGWKTRIEAGERLARTGAVMPNRLLGLYTEQKPAASGGVWDRAAAVQALETALHAAPHVNGQNLVAHNGVAAVAASTGPDQSNGTARIATDAAVAAALDVAWDAMVRAELEVPFATLYGEAVQGRVFPAAGAALAFRIGLLSEHYERVAQAQQPAATGDAFLIGIARGDPRGTTPPDGLGAAIRDAFAVPPPVPAADIAALIAAERTGEAILTAAARVGRGTRGNLLDVTEGLAAFRSLGLEDVARRVALELLLLERRG